VFSEEMIFNPHKANVAGYLKYGEQPRELITKLVDIIKPKTCLDVGCGAFGSLAIFQELGVKTWGIDGDYQLFDREDLIQYLPFFSVVDLEMACCQFPNKFDLVWSYEVAEHVENADNYINTLVNNSKQYIVMTHAVNNQLGHHHVNIQPDEYWIERIEKKNFKYDREMTAELKKIEDKYFNKSGLVFKT